MSAGTPLRTSQKLKLYGVRTQMVGTFAGRVLRTIDVGRQPHAVAHRHHHLALDDGQSTAARSRCRTAGSLLGGAERALLRADKRDRARERNEGTSIRSERNASSRDYEGQLTHGKEAKLRRNTPGGPSTVAPGNDMFDFPRIVVVYIQGRLSLSLSRAV